MSDTGSNTRVKRRIGLAALLAASLSFVASAPSSPASAAADVNIVPVVPARLLDTRPGEPTIDGQDSGSGPVAAQSFYRLQVTGRGGVQEGAAAAMLNVTAVTPAGPGFLTVFPCTATVPLASNVNYFAGQVRPNSVLAKLSGAGEVCVFSFATSDVVVDVVGYVPQGGSPVPVDPARLIETRVGPTEKTIDGTSQGIGRLKAGETVEFVVAGRGGVPNGVDAAYLNVTAISPSGDGFLTVFPCGSARPNASNVNYIGGDVRPNAVLATIGDGGKVCIFSLAAVDVIADVNAYLPAGGNREAIEPVRCADTRPRPEGETFDGLFEGDGKINAGGTYAVTIAGRCGIATDASAAYLNVTAVNPEAPGFLTVWPCDSDRPIASNVNYTAGEISPNAVLSRVSLDGNGQICIYSSARTDVVVDVNGYVPEPGLFGIEQVAAGNRHTCVLMSDATVRCAGDAGAAGDGEIEDRFDPVLVSGLDDATYVEAGVDHTCAIRENTTLWCWGYNVYGQLGDGTKAGDPGTGGFPRRLTPVRAKGLDGVIDVSSYGQHTCAITDDNDDGDGDTVWCWGRNNKGQLGDGTTDDQFTPLKVAGLPGAKTPVSVGAGNDFTCVLHDDGTVWCWGLGGRVGRGVAGSSVEAPAEATISGVAQLSVGDTHACATMDDATVQCWGLDFAGALGPRNEAIEDTLPAPVTGITGVVETTATDDATCVLGTDGTGTCWGKNGSGQLGRLTASGDPEPPAPMKPERDAKITQISSNGFHTCALLDDDSVVCWGRYFSGNLGVQMNDDAIVPVVYGSGDLRSS